ncbi:unnamed protein product [Peronospora belbahrii]|uniref:CS domain-containing protein n=1 Tax=Peronospora belbahrii TaxID=622444 RepID=A0ABN8CPD8_9STRA|nr:unnamed protein product [Peronospora belbahrii]
MVATPKFHVRQDQAWIFVHVHVPFVRVLETEFHVDGMDFSFFCKPYLLKLHFPHEVLDNDLTKAVYDPNKDNGMIVVHLPKKEPGQVFPDLDMLTKLLQPREYPLDRLGLSKAPLIEVLTPPSEESSGCIQDKSEELYCCNDKDVVPLTDHVQTDSSLLGLEVTESAPKFGSMKFDTEKKKASEFMGVRVTDLTPSYGFNNAYSDFFRVWHGEVSEIVSLPDPEHIQPEQRRILREAAEEQQFDIERYLMDFANQGDDMYFKLAMDYVPFWRKYPVFLPAAKAPKDKIEIRVPEPSSVGVDTDVSRVEECIDRLSLDATSPPVHAASSVTLTDAEQELLLRLPRKEFLLPEGSLDEALVVGGLVDILIGFVYDQLTTQGDSGVESTWTVSIVSPTLSWLDSNADLRAVVRSSVRRMITFPFLRQYDLALRSVREASELLKRGKRVVLRALLTLHRIVELAETQYLLNSLYVKDYCVWIQSVTDERLRYISVELDGHIAAFRKSETGWALEELERSLVEADDNNDAESSSSSDSDLDSSEATSSCEEGFTCHGDNDSNDEEEVGARLGEDREISHKT